MNIRGPLSDEELKYVCPGCGRLSFGVVNSPSLIGCFDCHTPRVEHLPLDSDPVLEATVRIGDRHAVLAYLASLKR